MKELNMQYHRFTPGLLALALGVTSLGTACNDDGDSNVVSSRAYKGHENDLDVNYFVNEYRGTVGTRLDDCQTCHRGQTFSYVSGDSTRFVTKNACDFCHLTQWPDESGFNEPQPTTFADTLNPYGADYLAAGRNRAALAAIAGDDSDGDGHTNAAEIADLKYPGDPESMPGQLVAPMREFSRADLEALAVHEQFLLANSHKQQYDDYATYAGVKASVLLEAAGVDLTDPEITGITVIAPDGYLKDFDLVDVTEVFSAGLYYAGLDTTTLGTECGFVKYPDVLPDGLTDGGAIPGEQWLLLAYLREGLAMDVSNLDQTSGKINGEGPYRIVVPQSTPGEPDRGSQYSPTTCNDGHDYDDTKNHNAGDMVRGVIAIRVNPLPAGTEDFDYKYGGWAYIDSGSLLVYGRGVTP
jgi:hypothetical protein